MARKKTTKAKSTRSSKIDFEKMSDFSAPRSYVSLAYGIITVVVLFVIVFLGIRSIAQRNQGDISEGTNIESIEGIADTHVVEEGETLYSIAEKFYQNGELWPTIAAENKITNPDTIEKGTKLNIPKGDDKTGMDVEVTPAQEAEPTATVAPTKAPETPKTTEQEPAEPVVPSQDAITGASYTVVRGDNLWNIAVRAYGDGYRWVDIARANNLANPDLIHAGNVFTLPR